MQEHKKMKKLGCVLLLLVMVSALFQTGSAEVMTGYQSYSPDITYLNNNGEYMDMASTPKGIFALGVIYQEKENISTLIP
jgi:hypothetical protein